MPDFMMLLLLFSHLVMSNSFATPWIVAHQAPLSMGFPRQECWSRLPFPSPGDLPDPGSKPVSPAWQADSLPSASWKPRTWLIFPPTPCCRCHYYCCHMISVKRLWEYANHIQVQAISKGLPRESKANLSKVLTLDSFPWFFLPWERQEGLITECISRDLSRAFQDLLKWI